MKRKNIVLFVNAIRPATFDALKDHKKLSGRNFIPVVIVDKNIKNSIFDRNGQHAHIKDISVINVDFDSPEEVRNSLLPIMDKIFAVTSQYENSILELKKLIPYLPYMSLPSERSLDWATEKKLMRDILAAYDRRLVPKYIETIDSSPQTVKDIEERIPYPMIIKPSALEGSLLVSLASNRRQLKELLGYTLDKVQAGYDTWIKRQAPSLLVEEFMEGDMYSIDTYVAADGTCFHTPLIKVVTGHKVGFEDFFGYMQYAPADLNHEQVSRAQEVAEKVCHALCLRSVTAHIELMKTKRSWKVIELGPRIGGFRHDIYSESYGINHIVNDILIRGGEKPIISSKVKRHTAFFNIYAPTEGKLATVNGLEIILGLKSFRSIDQVVNVGELAQFARNNGDPVFKLTLSHENKNQFEADVAVTEKALNFVVEENISNLDEADLI